MSRISVGLNTRPVCHQTRNRPPTDWPWAIVGANRSECGGSVRAHSLSKRGSACTSLLTTERPSFQAGSSAGNCSSTSGRSVKNPRSFRGTW